MSRRTRSSVQPRLTPYLLSAPAVTLYLLFMVVPTIYAAYLSTQALRVRPGGVFGIREQVFVGLDNYTSVLSDPELYASLGRLLRYGVVSVPLTLGLALVFALLLDAPRTRLRTFSRTAIFVPYAIPGVVAALLWGFMYLPSTSPFSYGSRALGGADIPFLGENGVFLSLANITVWGAVGFNMIIIYTSLRGISPEIYDSARMDGASELQIAWRIKVPLVVPALVLTLIFSLIGTLQLYGEPNTLRPLTSVITNTWAPLLTIYRDAFLADNLARAAAGSVVLAVGTVVLSLLVLGLVNWRSRAVAR